MTLLYKCDFLNLYSFLNITQVSLENSNFFSFFFHSQLMILLNIISQKPLCFQHQMLPNYLHLLIEVLHFSFHINCPLSAFMPKFRVYTSALDPSCLINTKYVYMELISFLFPVLSTSPPSLEFFPLLCKFFSCFPLFTL